MVAHLKGIKIMRLSFSKTLRILLINSIISLLTFRPSFAVPSEIATPCINGTFIQLSSAQGEWLPSKWENLFYYFRQVNLSQLVIQWTIYDEISFYPSENHQNVQYPPLEIILQLADNAGMQVYIGLVHDSLYWNKIDQESTLVRRYLDQLLSLSVLVASELNPLVERHPSFKGWYIPQEIDDINWLTGEAKETLFNYLGNLRGYLHHLSSGKSVMLSGFSNATINPQTLEIFWSELLKKTAIDIILFQDGIGTNKLQVEELPVYLTAIHNAVKTNLSELHIVVEIFTQTAGSPIDNREFQAIPAPLGRIKQQIIIASSFSSTIIAFSIPEYMSPQGGRLARQLYKKYLNMAQ
ncbi:MAG: DUF4434 domain-containing protein [bacterium]